MCLWCFARARVAAAAAAKSKNSSKGFAGLQQHSRSHLSWSDFIKVIKGDFNYLRTRSHGRGSAAPVKKGCSSSAAGASRSGRPTDRPAAGWLAGLIDSNLRIINKDFPVGILTTVRSVMSRCIIFALYPPALTTHLQLFPAPLWLTHPLSQHIFQPIFITKFCFRMDTVAKMNKSIFRDLHLHVCLLNTHYSILENWTLWNRHNQ